MDIIWGCDCNTRCLIHAGGDTTTVPAAFLVERDGKEIKVCTRCDLSGDRYIARLFDAHSDANVFFHYDALGAIIIIPLVEDKVWDEFCQRRSLR